MLSIRSGVLAALLVAALSCSWRPRRRSPGTPAPAAPGRSPRSRSRPKHPTATDSLTVSFLAGKIRRDQRYEVTFSGAENPSGYPGVCTNGYAARSRGVVRRGQRVCVTLDPLDRRGWPVGPIARAAPLLPDDRADHHQPHRRRGSPEHRRDTQLQDRPGQGVPGVQEPPGVPVKVTVLDGSNITVQATGRPDRTFGVGGIVRGEIPGRFNPNTDISVVSMAGDFFLRTFQADAICAGTVTTYLPLTTGGPSNLVLKASGDGIWTLALAVDPLSLAGCPAPAAPATTTVTLTGHVTPVGLLKLPLSGSVTGVPIATGVTATVTVNLLLNVDLSGKGLTRRLTPLTTAT